MDRFSKEEGTNEATTAQRTRLLARFRTWNGRFIDVTRHHFVIDYIDWNETDDLSRHSAPSGETCRSRNGSVDRRDRIESEHDHSRKRRTCEGEQSGSYRRDDSPCVER